MLVQHLLTVDKDIKQLLYAWGSRADGRLGDGVNSGFQELPVQVGSSSWAMVSAGYAHTAAIRSDGGLFTWGYNISGQLGLNDTTNRSSPVQVGSSSWTAVSAGGFHTAAIRSDGGLFTWGNNGNGHLGLNDTTNRSSPVQVGSSSWTAVSAGDYHTMGITTTWPNIQKNH